MERKTLPMFRYGEADFDQDYMNWGLHDPKVQVEEAHSILHIVGASRPLRILDLACGVGTHAIHFALQGHKVTAVDLSATFTEEGRKRAGEAGVDVTFEVGDIKTLSYEGCFDLVTWVEKSFFDKDILQSVHRYLADGGHFIFDIRNPEHPKTKRLSSNWRSWREENGVYYLELHETDEDAGVRHNLWVEIDTNTGTIIEKPEVVPVYTQAKTDMLIANGFRSAEYRTIAGDVFSGGEEPCWLWVVGQK